MSERMRNLTGDTIITIDGKKYKLGKVAGYGAQGVVYEDETGDWMIKLYYPTGSKVIDNDILERLRFIRNVRIPANFVKIEEIIDEPYIGYVMRRIVDHTPLNTYLVQDQEKSFSEWYNQRLGLPWRRLCVTLRFTMKAMTFLTHISARFSTIRRWTITARLGFSWGSRNDQIAETETAALTRVGCRRPWD